MTRWAGSAAGAIPGERAMPIYSRVEVAPTVQHPKASEQLLARLTAGESDMKPKSGFGLVGIKECFPLIFLFPNGVY